MCGAASGICSVADGQFSRIITIEYAASFDIDEPSVNSSANKPISTSDNNNEQEIAAGLVHRVIAGDKNAEGELYARYLRGTLRFLRTELGRLGISDLELADDLAQDTFVTVIGKLRNSEHGLKEPEKLGSYILGIARNLARAWRRKRKRQQTEPDLPSIDRIHARHGNPVKQLESMELATLVRSVLKELPVERDREILRRVYLSDEDKDRICKDLAIEVTHFNRVIYRARRRLRGLMEAAQVVR